MKNENNHDGLLIGIAYTIASLLLTWTFIVPIISVLPGTFVELLARKLVDNDPYSNVGNGTIVLLIIIFIIALTIALINIKRTNLRGGKITKFKIALIMLGMYFIVHTLGFYIYWGLELNYRGDGQLIFAAVDSFPKSSWAFIPIGLIIDVTKNYKRTAKSPGMP